MKKHGYAGLIVCPVVAGLSCGNAFAATEFHPFVAANYEHISNVFALPDADQSVSSGGDTTRDDTLLRYTAGMDGSIGLGREKFSFSGEGRKYQYNHFGDALDHNEYRFAGSLTWSLWRAFDGSFDYNQEQVMAAFAERATEKRQLTLDKIYIPAATLNIQVAPQWQVVTAIRQEDVYSPQPTSDPPAPDFEMRETIRTVGVRYAGFGKLNVGVDYEWLNGRYFGIEAAPSFKQTSPQVVVDYSVNKGSNFSLRVGRTNRTETLGDTDLKTAASTGSLSYEQKIMAKTVLKLEYGKAFHNYIAAGNSSLETSYSASLQWKPTGKTAIAVSYSKTRSEYSSIDAPALDPAATSSSGREDDANLTTAEFRYDVTRWLLLDFYANFDKRDSNTAQFQYKGNVVGAQARIQFGK